MIPKYSVKRPYTVLVAVVLVIVLGVVSLTRMTTDLLPAMNLPYVIVVTTDVGASPEEVEKDVTSPIEAAMATTSNINNVSSMSYDNYSMVILEYEQSTRHRPRSTVGKRSFPIVKKRWEASLEQVKMRSLIIKSNCLTPKQI